MRSLLLGFAAGVGLLQTRAALPGAVQAALLLIALMLAAVVACRMQRASTRVLARIASGAITGFLWAALLATHYLAEELPVAVEGQELTLTGVVANLPYRFERGLRFHFAVEQATGPDGSALTLPSRVALSWYDDPRAQLSPPALHPGERWRLSVKLKRPHGNANPGGFDYEAWLLEQGLRATGSVRGLGPDSGNRRLAAFVFSPTAMVEGCRGWLRERMAAALAGQRYAGVIIALVIGDQRDIGQDDWKVFTRTGIGHLVSISGLHITMVAGLFAALVQALWRRSFYTRAQLPLLLPAQKAAALAGTAAALVYVLLAGFGVPAQRTLYMIAVLAIALWTGRIASVSHVLCTALAVVLLLDPWAVLWPGFWLSFSAVAVILYVSVGRARPVLQDGTASRMQTLCDAARTQYAVTVGLVPLTLLLFGQISLVSPLANAVAIPLVSFAVTPLALAGSVAPAPLSAWLLLAAHWLVAQLALLLEWLSGFALAVWAAPIPAWWMFALGLTGMLWLLAPRGWPARWLGLLLWLPLLLNAPDAPEHGFRVTAFDVGQGNALLVETASHRLLYDTGPAYTPDSDGGSRVILPYLRYRGISRLDAMLVSHSDIDHAGGALSVLDEIDVGWVGSSLEPDHEIINQASRHSRCLAGQNWTWDGVRFEMLHPTPSIYDIPGQKPNGRSCTIRVSAGGVSMLLAGDIEAPQESQLLSGMPQRLPSTVLLAPHHGSGTSSTPDFLDAVAPQIAVFQVGYRNRYRHPKAEVEQRYALRQIRGLRSDRDGAISLDFAQSPSEPGTAAVSVDTFRTRHRRYWHGD
ncbi:DNA internalization-related competence protein ComEC/Rec2 [Noviherbaspirillum soli]|uniref:DNA internalization-related competence protein ComEC/Rec2 n=1 Tax=Noviherbaspirillum soli TaxID=1064518 RepID=UPI00188C3812|nr:DNA internalization-related competence protein ComEC/Rec2 [Noviherbaspirillum soli]